MLNFFEHHSLVEGTYPLSEIQVIDEIGKGNASVYNAMIKGKTYALKQIQVKTDYEYQKFLQQISLMQKLSKQTTHMVQYFDYFITTMNLNQYHKQKYAYIIMECAEKNLGEFIRNKQRQEVRLAKEEICIVIDFLLKAYSELEDIQVAHCDIKPENILLMNSTTMKMKICDVGSCKVVNKEQLKEATIWGTLPFLAPQLIRIHSKKIKSPNAFKSDVYSFGLVLLYMLTYKKFTSQERRDINQEPYFQVISEWIREAKETTNHDSRVAQILKLSLEFDDIKRPSFNQLRKVYEGEKKKKSQIITGKIKKLKQEEEKKISKYPETIETSNFQSVQTTKINLFKSRNLVSKISTKTSTNGFPKLRRNSRGPSPTSRNQSPSSPISKRQPSCLSSSPDRYNNFSIMEFKKIIYVNEEEKQMIPFDILSQEEKIFVLSSPTVSFKKAEIVSILKSCPLDVIYQLAEVQGRKIYIDHSGVEGIGLAQDAPLLNFSKVYANFEHSSFVGGFKDIFRVLCSIHIDTLDIRLTKSEVTYDEVINLLDRLYKREIKTFSLCWEDFNLTTEERLNLTQKIARLSVRKLTLLLNDNYIQYQKQCIWHLPKNLQTFYFQCKRTSFGKIIDNFSISLSKCELKELYLNLEHNDIQKSQVNFLIKNVVEIKTLQKLIINLSSNPIKDITYMIGLLIELKNVTSLELRIYNIGISIDKIYEAISQLKVLFEYRLKILKIGYERKTRKNEFIQIIKQALQEIEKNVLINVLGYDNEYFLAYIKKKDKSSKTHKNISTNRIKGEKNYLGHKTMQQRHENKKAGQCLGFYTTHSQFENYICLGCSEMYEKSKYEYFCKYCIESCEHQGHNICKVYEKHRCCCAFSEKCKTDITKKLCAEKLRVKYKKQFDCHQCMKSFCSSCVQKCLFLHKQWVDESNQHEFFQCGRSL